MKRNLRIDVARGMLILYIITIIHGIYWIKYFNGPWKSIVLLEMPCIFFISGFSYALMLSNGLPMESFADYRKFLIKRAGRILIPYWFYAAVCLCIIFVWGDPRFFESIPAAIKTIYAWLNPLVFGSNYSLGKLNAHLWFIGPFLCVSLVLPLLAKVAVWRRLPVWAWLFVSFTIIALVGRFSPSYTLTTVTTYTIWAILGFAAAGAKKDPRHSRIEPLTWFLATIAILAMVGYFDIFSLDMQKHKFPPDALFFVFSVGWVALLLLVCSFVSEESVQRLSSQKWLLPFINKGYSIYMWQGVAYTIAIVLGTKFSIPVLLMWLLAVLLTIGFGLAAAPLEAYNFFPSAKKKIIEAST